MAGLFGSSPKGVQPIRYSQLNVPTSTAGVPIPVGWGRNRAGTNLLWYGGFRSTPTRQSAGGKGGGGGIQSYQYSTAIIMAMSEGQIAGVLQVWSNKDVTSLGALGLTCYVGSLDQVPPTYITDNFPADADSYAGTSYVFSPNYQLGTSPDIPAHNFEISFYLDSTGAPGYIDANPGDIIIDYLTNERYGVPNFLPEWVDSTSLGIGQLSGSSYWTYCRAAALLMSPLLTSLEQAYNTLQRWAQLTNSWIFWSGTQLKFAPLGDLPISANGAVYLPDNSPAYTIGPGDYCDDGSSLPVVVTRSDPLDAHNRVQLDISDRSLQYNNNSVQWQDQTSIDKFGELSAQSISATEVCDAGIAATMAALIGQRMVWIRNEYRFKLPASYFLLEPGSRLLLNEPNIGIVNQLVRVRELEESETGEWSVLAEEFPVGVGTTGDTATQSDYSANLISRLVDPGMVNPPLILEPPSLDAGSSPQLWIGLSGGDHWGGARIYISLDGGMTYAYIGTVYSGQVQGHSTTAILSTSDPDTTDSLTVLTAVSDAEIPAGATASDADAGRTMFVLGSEVMSYGSVAVGGIVTYTATAGQTTFSATYQPPGLEDTYVSVYKNGALLSVADYTATDGATVVLHSGAAAGDTVRIAPSFTYTLTYLRRGLLGTSVTTHAAGEQFTKLDRSFTFRYVIPTGYSGALIYLKFLSFNIFGNALQNLADVDPYTHVVTATGGSDPGPGGSGLPIGGSAEGGGSEVGGRG